MTYGTVQGVADLSSMWTDGGSFSASTVPTSTVVSGWLEDVSNLLDTALEDECFTTPITVAEAVSMCDLLVEGIVKDLVDYSHGAGRFFTKKALDAGISPFMAIDEEIHDWVKRKTVGLEKHGVPRNESEVAGRSTASFAVLS